LIGERALPCSGRPGDADDSRSSSAREKQPEQVSARRTARLDPASGASERAKVSCDYAVGQSGR
jgi:hypothetical protein